jgi:sigma-B regulation protein RsbU (phosphoserine phosphatase)
MSQRSKLLVVDDEPANLQKLKRTFVREFEVYEASSGEAALRLLKEGSFDVIITDQRMPGISGVELLRESLTSNLHAIRIILTGFTDTDDLMDAINEGQVHRYITKPWEPFSLKQTVMQDLELRDLKRENHLLAEQLRIAREVQKQLFPQSLPRLRSLDYVGMCRTAREVGGDYYDFLQFQPEQLWMAVADISGKGISAALLMANLQALLRSRAPLHGGSLADLVRDVNLMLHATTDPTKFASLFLGIFDGETRQMRYVNAGHCFPLVIRCPQNGLRRTEFLEPTGTLVGLFPEAEYEEATIQLQQGDLLVVYTDGITEAFNPDWVEFGEERLHQLVSVQADLTPPDLSRRILEEVASHQGSQEQNDDLTLVLARVT